MELELIDNRQKSLLTFLEEQLPKASYLVVAVAFVKSSGLRLLAPRIQELLDRGGQFEIVFGLDFHLSEPGAIRTLLKLQSMYPSSVVCQAYAGYRLRDIPNFHPKLYIVEEPGTSVCFTLGSSNLTGGGLKRNVELNLGVSTVPNDPLALIVTDTFRQLKTQKNVFPPDEEYLSGYEVAYKVFQRKGKEAARDPGVRQMVAQLKEQEKPLRKASITQLEIIKQAVAQLTKDKEYAHLSEITQAARQMATTRSIEYDWDTFHNSVRGRLNENVVGKKTGLELFERPDNIPGTGLYRLRRSVGK